jgi:hypothetical protein
MYNRDENGLGFESFSTSQPDPNDKVLDFLNEFEFIFLILLGFGKSLSSTYRESESDMLVKTLGGVLILKYCFDG